jgi:ribosomal protein L24
MKKGDNVKILSGQYRGKTGKVIATSAKGDIDIAIDGVALGIRNGVGLTLEQKTWVTERIENLQRI